MMAVTRAAGPQGPLHQPVILGKLVPESGLACMTCMSRPAQALARISRALGELGSDCGSDCGQHTSLLYTMCVLGLLCTAALALQRSCWLQLRRAAASCIHSCAHGGHVMQVDLTSPKVTSGCNGMHCRHPEHVARPYKAREPLCEVCMESTIMIAFTSSIVDFERLAVTQTPTSQRCSLTCAKANGVEQCSLS
jgi:hypothetical protein